MYDISYEDDPPLHYLFADRSGASLILEFVDGSPLVQRREGPWQLMVNFTLAGSDAEERAADWRYATGERLLEDTGGVLDTAAAFELLAAVQQEDTQWSVVYDMSATALEVATGRRFDRPHRLAVEP